MSFALELEQEKDVLSRLIYRSKNQHKSSFALKMMSQLKRLLRNSYIQKEQRAKILDLCQRLYIECSGYVHMGYFLPFNLTVMCISARIFYIVSRVGPAQKKSKIDDIFSALENK